MDQPVAAKLSNVAPLSLQKRAEMQELMLSITGIQITPEMVQRGIAAARQFDWFGKDGSGRLHNLVIVILRAALGHEEWHPPEPEA